MAGNFRSGRKRNAQESIDPNDRPLRPDDLDQDGLELWDKVVLPAEHLRKADSQLCQTCCEMWSLYRSVLVRAKANPVDKDTRIAVTNYWQQWRLAMEKLGLDPLGRARMSEKVKRKQVNPLEEFGVVG